MRSSCTGCLSTSNANTIHWSVSLFKKFLAESRRLLICAIPSRYYQISVTQAIRDSHRDTLRNRLHTVVQDFCSCPTGCRVTSRHYEKKKSPAREREKSEMSPYSPSLSFHFTFLFQVVPLTRFRISLPLFISFSSIYVILSPSPSIYVYTSNSLFILPAAARRCRCCPLVYFPFPIVETTTQDAIKEPRLARKKMTSVGIMESSRRPPGCVRGLYRFYQGGSSSAG